MKNKLKVIVVKKALFICILCVSMFFLTFAIAENQDGTQITDALMQAGITEPVQLSQWGDTVVCFAETGGVKRLIVLERHNGAWQIVIDNPTALIQERDWPELLLDSDNAVFWTYKHTGAEMVRYHSSRSADGTWGVVDQYTADSGFGEYTHVWSTVWDDARGGEIVRTFSMYSDDDNDHGIQLMEVLPASWMADCVHHVV